MNWLLDWKIKLLTMVEHHMYHASNNAYQWYHMLSIVRKFWVSGSASNQCHTIQFEKEKIEEILWVCFSYLHRAMTTLPRRFTFPNGFWKMTFIINLNIPFFFLTKLAVDLCMVLISLLFLMQDLIDKRICKTWIISLLGFNMEVDIVPDTWTISPSPLWTFFFFFVAAKSNNEKSVNMNTTTR